MCHVFQLAKLLIFKEFSKEFEISCWVHLFYSNMGIRTGNLFKSMGKFSCVLMPSECSEPRFFTPLHSFIAFSCPHQDPATTWVEAGGTKPRRFSLAPLSRTLCEPNSPAEVYLLCLRGEEGAERALCCSRVGAGWKHLLPVSSSVTSMQMEARCTEP